ncbi:trigger factor-like isoform X3 [Mangifera indica]|uniref:trigger factor-like isoform X3 n=1 Tax=Mangifera indica TaxID=29780 RepID=UPI001CF9A7EC|nr:trigger factor-like isoform X3 [Mangifera indica]
MEIAVKPFLIGVNPRTLYHKHMVNVSAPTVSSKRARFGPRRNCKTPELSTRSHKYCSSVFAVLSGVEDVSVSSSQFDDFLVTISGTDDTRKLKVSVEVSGTKTRAIFDDVFDKMVAEAQPIPGFRRVKGGKTPNIPRDILLEVLGPSKVYKEVIKKVINSTIAEYVEKEGLKVSTDLRVEQSFEDLEDMFEPDEKFSFDAVIQLQETD